MHSCFKTIDHFVLIESLVETFLCYFRVNQCYTSIYRMEKHKYNYSCIPTQTTFLNEVYPNKKKLAPQYWQNHAPKTKAGIKK